MQFVLCGGYMISEKRAKKYGFWKYFEEIAAIPHGSGNTKKISNYLVDFAKENGLKYVQEKCGNVIIYLPASEGREKEETLILQGHMDMVAVKEKGTEKDLELDGLDLFMEKGYVGARGTSLGGDDGIALAYALSIMADNKLSHPAIEAVFTVNEEVGMDGAHALDAGRLSGKTMINLDNETEGELIVGCAGGAGIECVIPVEWKSRTANAYEITVSGLKGGHSGTEINDGRVSAVTIIARFFAQLKLVRTRIIDIQTGEKDNAIAKSGTIKFICSAPKSDVIETVNFYADVLKEELASREPGLKFDFKVLGEGIEVTALHKADSERIMDVLLALPQGVREMSADIPGLVETSDNIGIVSLKEDGLHISALVRSSYESAKQALCDKIIAVASLGGGSSTQGREYPGWQFSKESPLLSHVVKNYREFYGSEPVVKTIHAGLECGIFADKIKKLDCISMGPEVKDIHTVNERLSVASAEKTYDFLLKLLENEIVKENKE